MKPLTMFPTVSVVFCLLGFAPSTSPPELEPPPQLRGEWQLEQRAGNRPTDPSGIAMDSTGAVYVVDMGVNRIQKVTTSGQLLRAWGGVNPDFPLEMPFGIAVGPDDSVYVTEVGADAVRRLDADGHLLQRWGRLGTNSGEFHEPLGIAVDDDGFVYVIDGQNRRVQKFDAKGEFILSWGEPGSGSGTLATPVGIAVSRTGFVYVSDPGNARVTRFTTEGVFLGSWGLPAFEAASFWPYAVAVDARGDVVVSDPGASEVYRFSETGVLKCRWAKLQTKGRGLPGQIDANTPEVRGRREGSGPGATPALQRPTAFAMGPRGEVLLLDRALARVQLYTDE